jgi:hypothetical protein
MKAIKLTALGFSMMCGFAFGQVNAPEVQAQEQTQKMKVELGLTAAQEVNAYEINFGIIIKNKSMLESTYTQEVKNEAIEQNNSIRIDMFKQVLTAEQFAKFEKDAISEKKTNVIIKTEINDQIKQDKN